MDKETKKQYDLNKLYAMENQDLMKKISELQKELEPRTRIKTILEDICLGMFMAFLTAGAVSVLISMIISIILNQNSMCL